MDNMERRPLLSPDLQHRHHEEDITSVQGYKHSHLHQVNNSSRVSVGTYRQVACCLCAVLGSLSFGLALGYSSPADSQFKKDSVLTDSQSSWFGALLNVGAIAGGPVAGVLVERIGRKPTIMLSALPYVVGWLLVAATLNPYVLYVGRVLTGIGVGMTCLCVPLYIAEVASKERRGKLVSAFQIGSTSGILIMYCLGLHFNWKWLATLSSIPPCVMVILLLFTPESPRWLLIKRGRPEALRVIGWLREGEGAQMSLQECNEMETAVLEQKSQGRVSLSQFLTDTSLYRPLIMSSMLMVLQQFCGINAVIFYTQSIFESSGYKDNAGIPAVIVSAVKVFFTGVMVVLVDRTGRRPLFIVGGLGMALSCALLGAFFYLVSDLKMPSSEYGWMSLTGLIAYIISFSIGWGAIPWLMMSEVFPVKAKGQASSVATAINWTCSFIVTKAFQPLLNTLGAYTVFWGFSVVCVLGVIYACFCLIETKGRSLEEIERTFRQERILCKCFP